MTKPLPLRLIRKNRSFYWKLRSLCIGLFFDHLLADKRTIKAAAQRHGLKVSTYYRLRVFFRDHRDLVMTAQRNDNWRPVEEILFPEILAAYPDCADYNAAFESAMADWRTRTGTPLWRGLGQAGKGARPKGTKRKSSTVQTPTKPEPASWLKRLLAKLGRWFDASDPR